jgi:hypothetical protein
MLGLAALLLDLLVSGPDGASKRTRVLPEDCIYEVYQGDRSLGTVFLRHADNLPAILSRLGVKAPTAENCDIIPCNRTIKLDGANTSVFVDKIPGSHLIAAGKRVDVNLADSQDLEAVPGIGPQLSARIISIRNTKGVFRDLAELRQVPGIGRKKLSDVIQYLEVGPSEFVR